MENKEWSPNDWQGKRRDQVEYSSGIGSIMTLLLLITLIVFYLFL